MYTRQLFMILFRTLRLKYDYIFDWTILKRKEAGLPPIADKPKLTPEQQAKNIAEMQKCGILEIKVISRGHLRHF